MDFICLVVSVRHIRVGAKRLLFTRSLERIEKLFKRTVRFVPDCN